MTTEEDFLNYLFKEGSRFYDEINNIDFRNEMYKKMNEIKTLRDEYKEKIKRPLLNKYKDIDPYGEEDWDDILTVDVNKMNNLAQEMNDLVDIYK